MCAHCLGMLKAIKIIQMEVHNSSKVRNKMTVSNFVVTGGTANSDDLEVKPVEPKLRYSGFNIYIFLCV